MNGAENRSFLSKWQGHTLDETIKRGGKTIQTFHRVVSPDGRTMTVLLKGGMYCAETHTGSCNARSR
jgi:hypothetical protein